MPPFLCRVEVVPHEGSIDPESISKLKQVQNSGVDGGKSVSELSISHVITFILDCETHQEATAQVQAMSDELLINSVLATPKISVTELS